MFIENIGFLDRGASKQPITIVHHRSLTSSNRVLVIAMDDNARVFSTEMEHPVMIGVPIADRISDLTPPISDTAVKGSPQWENAQITDPNSDDMIRFLKDERQPYAEERYGPSFHKVLFGYSLGGIFTLQTLITEPEPFDSYITASPSLWYRNTTMKRSQSRPQNT